MITKNKIIAQDKEHLKSLIQEHIIIHGNECNLNHIDTSFITDMTFLFKQSQFNGDISEWNVSNVNDMSYMFYGSKFNGDISKWNVSSLINMHCLFNNSQFNGDISNWNVSNVMNMNYTFIKSKFNENISNWNVSSLITMIDIFKDCECEKPWWAIEDNEQRNLAIENYHLMKKLNTTLNKNEKLIPLKKSKI